MERVPDTVFADTVFADELTYWWMVESGILVTGVKPTVDLAVGTHEIILVVRDVADQVSTDTVKVVVHGGFLRGDSNIDGTVDISDGINTLGYLFTGTGEVTCQDAADANDDGEVDISDAIFTLGFLFLGNPATIQTPYPDSGSDTSPDQMGCDSYSP